MILSFWVYTGNPRYGIYFVGGFKIKLILVIEKQQHKNYDSRLFENKLIGLTEGKSIRIKLNSNYLSWQNILTFLQILARFLKLSDLFQGREEVTSLWRRSLHCQARVLTDKCIVPVASSNHLRNKQWQSYYADMENNPTTHEILIFVSTTALERSPK